MQIWHLMGFDQSVVTQCAHGFPPVCRKRHRTEAESWGQRLKWKSTVHRCNGNTFRRQKLMDFSFVCTNKIWLSTAQLNVKTRTLGFLRRFGGSLRLVMVPLLLPTMIMGWTGLNSTHVSLVFFLADSGCLVTASFLLIVRSKTWT